MHTDLLKHKISSLFRGTRIYLFLNILYFAFLLLYFFTEFSYRVVHDIILFYFDAPYKDFQLWFPKFHFIAYSFITGIKGLVAALLFAVPYFFYTRKTQIETFFSYNKYAGYIPFIKHEGVITAVCLVFYLIIYFFSKFFLPEASHEKSQVFIARGFLLHIIVQSCIIIAVHSKKILNYLKNFLLSPRLPHNVAVFRILFFLYLAQVYRIVYSDSLPTVSLSAKVPLPYIGWLIDIIPVNADLYTVFVGIGVACCFFIVIGFKTRWFLILNALCVFYIIATPNFFGKLWHHQIVIWISWFFAFSRCYDVFSIDAWRNKTAIVKSADYTFPVRFVWLTLGIIYFWAGFYKLWDCGFDWALSSSMINQVQLEWAQNYDKIPDIRIDKYPILLRIGGLAAILFELSYIFWILQPKYRWIAVVGGLFMHNVIGYFMYISFLSLLQVFYIFYIDFGKWFEPKNIKAEVRKQYSKLAFGFGIFILCANFLCGMFSIDSYPFSAYPKYAALISDTLKIIHFDARTENGTTINVHAVAKKNNFRWESYGWLEYNLIRDFETGVDISERLSDYWQIWVSHNSELKQCKTVSVSVIERPVAPEGANKLKTCYPVGFLKIPD